MECPNCHVQNDEDALFCKKCGTRLTASDNEMSLLPSVVPEKEREKDSVLKDSILQESSASLPEKEKALEEPVPVQAQKEEEEEKKALYQKPGMEYMDPGYKEPKVLNIKGGSWWWVLAWPATVLVIFLISFLFVWIQVLTE